jgi:cyclopropane-fatty-acyl-phospholipid synthase
MKETMTNTSASFDRTSDPLSSTGGIGLWLSHLAREAVWHRLRRLTRGELTIIDGETRRVFGQETADSPHRATIVVHNPRTYVDVALWGTIGAGNAYRQGYWDCDDLTTLVRIFVLNRELLDGMEAGLARITSPWVRVLHWLNRNTRAGSRKNIAAHYDLGNDFFRLMLDDTMMYSCAYFDRVDATLEEASRAKNDLICRKLRLDPDDHLLEIGTGWGGFAIQTASRYGCRITTTTISQQQYEVASQRVKAAGLQDRVTVLRTDYRDLPALGRQFDKLVSIEMIEAVGHRYLDEFFTVCGGLLKSNGLMLLQGITIDERYYERAKRSVDFIQYFIFPGSSLHSVSAMVASSAGASDLGLADLEDLGRHYPPTLRAWRKNLTDTMSQVQALGFGSEFLRLWDLYLSYCEGGFLERSISVAQLLFAKPDWRPAHDQPSSRPCLPRRVALLPHSRP